MLTYVVKRVLLMIPTFIGVSCVIWLVMVLAPGDPSGSQAGAGLNADLQESAASGDRDRQNLNARMFRQQFGLDRPAFLNRWSTLEAKDVEAELRVVFEGVAEHSVARVREATRTLEDWSDYSVPPLLELLHGTTGEFQTAVLARLRHAAFIFKPIREAGRQATSEEIAEDQRIQKHNRWLEADEMGWADDADATARAPVLAAWKTWEEEQTALGRWSYRDSFWERTWLTVSDTKFGRYWGGLLRLDLGLSFQSKKPVLDLVFSKLKYSLSLVVPSFILAWIIAVFLGVMSAARHNSGFDQGASVVLFMLYSIPSFLAGTVLQQWLAVDLGWFPTSRFEDANAQDMNTWEHFKDILHHLVLPMACYTYGTVAYISRQARSGMLQVMQSDYIRTARAKGLPERAVLWKHGVRNGMMPLITMLGTALPILLAGSVVIEYIFDIPGFGSLMIDSIFKRDYNVIIGISLLSAALTLIGLLITDIMYAAVDPRVSYK